MKVENRVDWVARQVRGKDVLDVGPCGFTWKPDPEWIRREWIHAIIKENAKSVLGIDISKKGIEWARRFGYNDIIYGNAENFSLGRKFDVIFAGELIEHLSNPGLFLRCAKKHLRKGGKLVLTTPNARHPQRWMRDKAMSPNHLQLYTMQILKQLLQANGFGKIKEFYLESNIRTLKGKLYAKLFLPLFPKFALTLGVVAEVKNERNSWRSDL